jgi:acetyl esterase/lipase
MTLYPPKGRNTRAAIMVFPGGGYEVLAIDLEGTEICDWVTARGMTCILLKYRVPQAWQPGSRLHQPPAIQPLQDAQRAIGLVRQRAASLNIDPHRIGVIGFSAGGHLVAAISNADKRSYLPVDAADNQPSRPDFALALYPGHLWSGEGIGLAPWITISRDAPPTFLLQCMGDRVDDVHDSIAYALALRDARVPVEMHLYAEGGHAFGLRPTAFPISNWPVLVEKWLHTIRIL